MIQKQFAENVAQVLKDDKTIIGLAVAGSWLTDEIDEWSDFDLVIVTHANLNADKAKMLTLFSPCYRNLQKPSPRFIYRFRFH